MEFIARMKAKQSQFPLMKTPFNLAGLGLCKLSYSSAIGFSECQCKYNKKQLEMVFESNTQLTVYT